MDIDILSLFPAYFDSPLRESILGRAIGKGLLKVNCVNVRDFTEDKHHKVDDRPYGGGPGMVMMPGPTVRAIRASRRPGTKVVYLSPEGKSFSAAMAREFATKEHLVLLSGHYEGIDQRVIDLEVDEIVSVGDFVLTSGCVAALLVLDALVRFIPGALGDETSKDEESFEGEGWLDCPHYTRPEIFEGKEIPPILKSGDHAKIAAWRREQARLKTLRYRPDLIGGK
jgi:tRNA (guanine37-N1)-methyltransferase